MSLLVGGPRIADAKKYRVTIDSRPRGATVLLGDGTKLGKTPLKHRLPAGEHVIIVRKPGYVETVETIAVSRRKRRFRLTLERAEMGEIKVVSKKGRTLNNADIYVDGKKVGSVPKVIKVAAGARQVEVKKDGYSNFDEWVEVSAGNQVVVRAFATPKAGATPAAGDDDEGDDDDEAGDDDEGDDDEAGDDDEVGDDDDQVAEVGDDDDEEDTKTADVTTKSGGSARAPGSLAVIRGGIDLGGRMFRYKQPMTNNLRPYDAFPFPLGRLVAELYPLGFLDSAALGGLGFTADLGFGFPLNSETKGDMPEAIATTWRDWSVGARYRFDVSPTLRLAGAGSYGKRSFNFDDENSQVEGEVPDVDYKQISLGADLETDLNKSMTLVLGARFLLLSNFGELGDRFNVAKSLGLGAMARLDYGLGERFDLIFRLAYQRASLTLEMQDAAFNAAGGTDQFLGLMVGIGVNL